MRVATGLLALAALACTAETPSPQPAPQPGSAVRPSPEPAGRWDGRLAPPPRFVVMDARARAALEAGSRRGTATRADVEAWAAPGGSTRGFVAATELEHDAGPAAHGHTLLTWVAHEMQGVEAELTSLDPQAHPPTSRREGNAMTLRYAVPLPGGDAVQVHGRAWLSPRGALRQALCQCAGSGCTDPPACRVPDAPADALPPETILGDEAASTVLATAQDDARVLAPPHLTPLAQDVLAGLASSGAREAPHRTERHVQGLRADDGSGVFLTDATWCAETAPCDAKTVAENRRKSEVDGLRSKGVLRSVQTRGDVHAAVPTYGYEILQRDGFWTRTTFWNRGPAVREVSCACAGMACALAQRTCAITPK